MRSENLATTAQNEWGDVGRPQVAVHWQLSHILVYLQLPETFT